MSPSRVPRVGIVDYEAGNLYNVAHALKAIGVESVFSADPEDLGRCDRIILPGVGAARAAMRSLEERGLVEFLQRISRPLLGICLGMQLLFSRSAEDGVRCLGRLDGEVIRFAAGGLKVPHMGWNQVRWKPGCPLGGDLPGDAFFYFVHSFFVRPAEVSLECGRTEYGTGFTSAVCRGTLWGVQFHPERSGPHGLQLLRNFVDQEAS